MDETLDGLLTFFASHHAIRAEKVLGSGGFATLLIPGPKELSPNCGVAVRFEYARRDEVAEALEARKVQFDEIHHYQPRTDAWDRPSAGESGARRFWHRGGR